VDVFILGVEHCVPQPHLGAPLIVCSHASGGHSTLTAAPRHPGPKAPPLPGDFILRAKPRAVVLETALTREHGARTGNAITPADQVGGSEAFFFRMFLALAERLVAEEEPLESDTWAAVKAQLFGEQIAYVAAFACGTGCTGCGPVGSAARTNAAPAQARSSSSATAPRRSRTGVCCG